MILTSVQARNCENGLPQELFALALVTLLIDKAVEVDTLRKINDTPFVNGR